MKYRQRPTAFIMAITVDEVLKAVDAATSHVSWPPWLKLIYHDGRLGLRLNSVTIVTPGAPAPVLIGERTDWIVHDAAGEVNIYNADDFALLYEPVPK